MNEHEYYIGPAEYARLFFDYLKKIGAEVRQRHKLRKKRLQEIMEEYSELKKIVELV